MAGPIDLVGGKVLVTLPLTEAQQQEFQALAVRHGDTCAFVPANAATMDDIDGAIIVLGNIPTESLHAQATR
ncbi:MAG: hypothetical protein IKG18_14520 [Atopobiaceae bacterium]|nr:hypothetical protein [Atopobiaceae bacterium]